MRRLPTPWFLVPVLVAGALGAVLGREVARVTCAFGSGLLEPDPPRCPGFEIVAAVIGAVVAVAGVAVVVNLALRSLAEWRELREGAADGGEPASTHDDGKPDAGPADGGLDR